MDTKARDIMSGELLVASSTMSVEEALKLLVNSRITGLPVVDGEGKAVGVLSEYDVIQQILSGGGASAGAKSFQEKITYTPKAICVHRDASFQEVLDTFVKTKVRRLPVIDDASKVVGIITRRDVMKVLYYRAKLSH